MLWNLTCVVNRLARSAAQALRLGQTTFEPLARGPYAVGSLRPLVGRTRKCLQSGQLIMVWALETMVTKVILYSLSHVRARESRPAAASAIAVVPACKLNTQNVPSRAQGLSGKRRVCETARAREEGQDGQINLTPLTS